MLVQVPRFWRLIVAVGVAFVVVGAAFRPVVAQTGDLPLPGIVAGSVAPLEETEIILVRQQVLIALSDNTFTTNYDQDVFQLGGQVTAEFVFDNPTEEVARLVVGIPMLLAEPAASQEGYLEVRRLQVLTNGVPVNTYTTLRDGVVWAAWRMIFAPEQTHLQVTYDLPATVDGARAELGYILQPTLAWAESASQIELAIQFPYAIDPAFVVEQGIYLGSTTPGYLVDGDKLIWDFESEGDEEPTEIDGVSLTFITPHEWQRVLNARTGLNTSQTAQNYWQLAGTYAALLAFESGVASPEIAVYADQAYRNAIQLAPENAALKQEYGDFLLEHAGHLLPIALLDTHAELLTEVAPPTATITPTMTPSPWPTDDIRASQTAAALETAAVVIAETVTPTPTSTPTPDPLREDLRQLAADGNLRGMMAVSLSLSLFLFFFGRRYRVLK